MSGRYGAVMLIGFGGPTAPDEIRPFLDNVLRGRPVPRERYEEVVRHYEFMGGKSPYNELTARQARALSAELRNAGLAIPVAVGLRNSKPLIIDALREIAGGGTRGVLGVILSAFQSDASWQRYQDAVEEARRAIGSDAPQVDYLEPFYSRTLFVEAVAVNIRIALDQLAEAQRAGAKLIFTAHSIPLEMAARSPYVEQLTESCAMVARQLGHESWTLAFQSRSGSPTEPWLEPDIRDALRKLQGGAAIVVPIGFLCDHIEVLYDLDHDAAQVARDAGVKMVRAAALNDHPLFIRMLAQEILRAENQGDG